MMKIFKWETWRSYRKYIVVALVAVLLGGLAAGATWYTVRDNSPPKLWAADDTDWTTVAANSDAGGPTREVPVYIEAQVQRLYGLHLGTVNRVRYKIVALTSVKMRFDTLLKGILSRYKTTWEVVEPPKLVSQEKKEGLTTRIVELTVAVWEPPSLPDSMPQGQHTEFLPPPANKDKTAPPPTVAQSPETAQTAVAQAATAQAATQPGDDANAGPVEPRLWPMTAEFIVSTDDLKNGLPKWEYIETPPINFGFASLVEPDADKHGLDFGPLGDPPDHPNRVGVAMVRAGYAITACGGAYLVFLMVSWWRRRKQPLPVPREIVLYREAMDSAERAKLTRSHLEQTRVAVRKYLGGATLSDSELIELWAEHPAHDGIVEVLTTLREAGRVGRLNVLEERKIAEVMETLFEERQQVVKPVTRWSRLLTAVGGRARKLSRIVAPVRKIANVPRAIGKICGLLRPKSQRRRRK